MVNNSTNKNKANNYYEKTAKTVMVNNSTNIYKKNNYNKNIV